MKKFFSSDKGKRVLIGLGLLALAMTLGYFLQSKLLESGMRWKQAIFFLVVSGTGIGGILYIFLARKGLMIGYGIFFYIALILILSTIVSGAASMLLALPIIVGPAFINYFAKKRKSSGILAKPRRSSKPSSNQISYTSLQKTLKEKAPLLVAKRASGTIYQMFLQNENLLFYKVGTFFQDLTEQNLKQQDMIY